MRNDWLSSMDSDPDIFSFDPFLFHNIFGSNLLHYDSSRNFFVPGSLALQEAFGHVTKLAGALLFWFSGCSSSNLVQDIARSLNGHRFGNCCSSRVSLQVKAISNNVAGFGFPVRSKRKSSFPFGVATLGKMSSFTVRFIWGEAKRLQSYHVLSLAAALVPPIQNLYVSFKKKFIF